MAGFTQKKDTELQTARKVQKARKILLLPAGELTIVDVKTAWAAIVKGAHPDVAQPDPAVVQMTAGFNELRQAKDYLVKHLEKQND